MSGDCRFPQLLQRSRSAPGPTAAPCAQVVGHEGTWAPDGLTYYGGDLGATPDSTTPSTPPTRRKPKLITTWTCRRRRATVHGLSISDDGNRGYFVSLGVGATTPTDDPIARRDNGLLIFDMSEIQARKPIRRSKLSASVLWKDGSARSTRFRSRSPASRTSSWSTKAARAATRPAQLAAACAGGLRPFPMARIIDISDETKPKIVSKLMLEMHDPANCDKVLPDLAGLISFTYGSHYCSVDNRHNATTLACGYFNSGIRVFDIRDPLRPKEIAYYNPAGDHDLESRLEPRRSRAAGSPAVPTGARRRSTSTPTSGTLWTTCQDNGFLMLKFTHGVWPFPESTTPPGKQN